MRLNADRSSQSVDDHYWVYVRGKNLTGVQQIGGALASALVAVANADPPLTYGVKVG